MAKTELEEVIRKRARADLILSSDRGEADLFLWEQSCRVAESARLIAGLPEVAAQVPDELASFIAGLYHAAGWAVRCRHGEVTRYDVLLSPISESIAEMGANLAEKSLGGIVPQDSLERAIRAVRFRIDRNVEFIEAKIVAEAENLEEFGLTPLWIAIRRGMLEGKGVSALLESWRRKQEYHFWPARLNDSFRFALVREMARERLASVERFMVDLAEQSSSGDLSRVIIGASGVPSS